MKNWALLLAVTAGVGLTACNSGSSNGGSGESNDDGGGGGNLPPGKMISLPAGTYVMSITLRPDSTPGCQPMQPTTMTSDGNGALCSSTDKCINVNLANNPCYNYNRTESSSTISGQLNEEWLNCGLDSATNTMTALSTMTFTGSSSTGKMTIMCNGNLTIQPASSSSTSAPNMSSNTGSSANSASGNNSLSPFARFGLQ